MTSRKTTPRGQLRRRSKELLIADMASGDPERQRKAAFEAGRRGMREAAELLSALLVSPEPDVRSAAAEALGKIGDRSAGDGLARLLADQKQPVFVRDTCAYALARLAYAPALDILISALRDPHETVRNCASAAVSVIVNSPRFRSGSRSPFQESNLQTVASLPSEESAFAKIHLSETIPASPGISPISEQIDSISELIVGLGMNFDEFPYTPIEKTLVPNEQRVNRETAAKVLSELITSVSARPTSHELDDIDALIKTLKVWLQEVPPGFGAPTTSVPVMRNTGAVLDPTRTIQKQAIGAGTLSV